MEDINHRRDWGGGARADRNALYFPLDFSANLKLLR